MNEMLNFINELEIDNLTAGHFSPNNLASDKIINYFNLLIRIIKQLKVDSLEKKNKLKL